MYFFSGHEVNTYSKRVPAQESVIEMQGAYF